jgi:hypothetical protein
MSVAGLSKVVRNISAGLPFQRFGWHCAVPAVHSQSSDGDRMVVPFARPRDIDHSVMVALDEKTESIGVGSRGAIAGIAGVPGVTATPEKIDRNKRSPFSRALAAVEIAQRRYW